MTIQVAQAMILAAGLGTRMRPLTEATAKPLLPLARRTLIDHVLDRLAEAGIERVVVNAHWQAERLAAHLAGRPQGRPNRGPGSGPAVVLRREPVLLDTGGAVAAALADGSLADAPLFVVNGDSIWLDGPSPTLARMIAAFDPGAGDALLLLHRAFQVPSGTGAGDFALDPWGRVRRPEPREIAPYVFAGVQLMTPALLAGEAAPPAAPPFGMNRPWDRAIAAGRLRAVVHDGLWFHLSTPADLAWAEATIAARATGETD